MYGFGLYSTARPADRLYIMAWYPVVLAAKSEEVTKMGGGIFSML